MTKTLLLRTAEAPPTRRRARKLGRLVLLLGACGAAAAGCASDKMLYTDSQKSADAAGARGSASDVKQASLKTADDDAPPPPNPDADGSGKWFDFSHIKTGFGLFPAPTPPPPPVDSFIVRPDGLVPEKVPETGTADAQLAGARDLFRRKEYAKAQELYHAVGQNARAPVADVQEGLFYEAECLRLQGYYPRAADTYNDLLNKFANTPYRNEAVQHMFDIANYWLEDTRKEMQEWENYKSGKSWFFWPRFVAWDKSKPVLDEQGRAVEKLEQVRYNDMTGPLADQALFFAGSVKMYNNDWKDADGYFTQIYEHHPNSPLAPKAIELAIMAKNLSTGGSDYDGRKAAEARKLVDAALRNYPELANDPDKRDHLLKQLAGITLQQADKDFKMAAFWKRTGHPGAAYFQFATVCQRYPNTTIAQEAAKEMQELRGNLEKAGGEEPRAPAREVAPAQPVIPASMQPGAR